MSKSFYLISIWLLVLPFLATLGYLSTLAMDTPSLVITIGFGISISTMALFSSIVIIKD